MDDANTNLIKQLENDNPGLQELTIPNDITNDDHNHEHHDSWERVGRLIGRNTHLKVLCFDHDLLEYYLSTNEFEKLCRGLVCNKSIEILKLNLDEYHTMILM